jgi:hypothetical protein
MATQTPRIHGWDSNADQPTVTLALEDAGRVGVLRENMRALLVGCADEEVKAGLGTARASMDPDAIAAV